MSGRRLPGNNYPEMPREATKTRRRPVSQSRPRPDPPWNVVLHNDWVNSMPRVVVILRRTIPGMTLKKATRIMWEAHTTGRAVVKSCHRELAELYAERLQGQGLTDTVEKSS